MSLTLLAVCPTKTRESPKVTPDFQPFEKVTPAGAMAFRNNASEKTMLQLLMVVVVGPSFRSSVIHKGTL